ncbi:SLC13 family permease [Nitratireductor sp. XY-223]|uniref:SLC13 family permease n=1 Tax=Nitratireductor sp. XY-223 TaxID=2561926 RepID=UPI0010AABDF1|nr:SLC13 family permease [Nitratireductor sp. XY-223]
MTVSLAVAIAIFFVISIRQWLPSWVRIWQVMLAGAVVLVATGRIAPLDAFKAIDWNVIGYLFGVFSIASALYDSGFPHTVSEKIAGSRASLPRALLLFVVLVSLISIVLTNDAGAVIGTPIALSLAIAYRIRPAVPLVALCVIVTVASMMSPVGNPQNILIVADGHFSNPIGTFALWLTVPTLVSLAFAYIWLLWCLNRETPEQQGNGDLPAPTRRLAWPAYLGAGLLAVLVVGDSLLQERFPALDVPLGYLSLVACLPVFVFSPHRISLFRAVDWHTLIFFVAMFVVTGAVLQSGALQSMLGSWQTRLDEPLVVTLIGFWASQLFSNVPVVEIYLNLLTSSDARTLMLLSAMSTLAGNLFIISAASNVIVVQQAEKFGATPFSFWQFTRLVIPVTIVSVAVSYAWIVWVMPG